MGADSCQTLNDIIAHGFGVTVTEEHVYADYGMSEGDVNQFRHRFRVKLHVGLGLGVPL